MINIELDENNDYFIEINDVVGKSIYRNNINGNKLIKLRTFK